MRNTDWLSQLYDTQRMYIQAPYLQFTIQKQEPIYNAKEADSH